MPITTMAEVKTLARIANRYASTAPTTATVGVIGDVLLDTVTGLTYELTSITTGPTTYVWTADTSLDREITLMIDRAEVDYLRIRGIDFETDDSDATVYPDAADMVAAEMVCYLMGIGRLNGRGKTDEQLGGRRSNYERKIFGYPISIVGNIERFQSAI